jgi:hypothetical protein
MILILYKSNLKTKLKIKIINYFTKKSKKNLI